MLDYGADKSLAIPKLSSAPNLTHIEIIFSQNDKTSSSLMTTSPKVLVIIVTWNKQQYVLDLLESLKTINYPTDSLDIVVIDNASEDDTVKLLKQQFPDVHLICNPENVGGTGGFNTGLSYAYAQDAGRYDYLWLLDNDVLVHQNALQQLVNILEDNADIAVAGSTMMQLDYPWRLNEMGAFISLQSGQLSLNRHFEEIAQWRGIEVQDLLKQPADLSKLLMHCQPLMDVDYVAAASLLIRADVAKEAGLWRDYFIHFDDVEWCLRIGKMGNRVVVSASSLIWHLSAAAKVPTWVLYYDNRNILDLMTVHGASTADLHRVKKYIRKKSVYYHLLGKSDLAELHDAALDDFESSQMGKKAIQLAAKQRPNKTDYLLEILLKPDIKNILVAFPVNLQATKAQVAFVQAAQQRNDLQIDFMPLPDGIQVHQIPRARFIQKFSGFAALRWLQYWQLRGKYDLIVQSDYQALIGLAAQGVDQLYLNDEGHTLRPAMTFKAVKDAILRWWQT